MSLDCHYSSLVWGLTSLRFVCEEPDTGRKLVNHSEIKMLESQRGTTATSMQLWTAEAEKTGQEGRRGTERRSEAVKAAALPGRLGASAGRPNEVWPSEAGAAAGST